MIRELGLAGIYFPALLIWAIAAMVLNLILRRLLRAIGFYRLVWHRALFDFALFVILLGGVRALAIYWMPS